MFAGREDVKALEQRGVVFCIEQGERHKRAVGSGRWEHLSGRKMGDDTWVAIAPMNAGLTSDEKRRADQALTWAASNGYESP